MSAELDRNKPFAPISGDSPARFYQNGMYFDARGKRITAEEASGVEPGGPTEHARVEAMIENAQPTDEQLNNLVAGASMDPSTELRHKMAVENRKSQAKEPLPEDRAGFRMAEVERVPATAESAPEPYGPAEGESGEDQTEESPEPEVEPDTREKIVTPLTEEQRAETRAELESLHVSKIKKMLSKAGKIPASGAGSKKKNIDALMTLTDHVEHK